MGQKGRRWAGVATQHTCTVVSFLGIAPQIYKFFTSLIRPLLFLQSTPNLANIGLITQFFSPIRDAARTPRYTSTAEEIHQDFDLANRSRPLSWQSKSPLERRCQYLSCAVEEGVRILIQQGKESENSYKRVRIFKRIGERLEARGKSIADVRVGFVAKE